MDKTENDINSNHSYNPSHRQNNDTTTVDRIFTGAGAIQEKINLNSYDDENESDTCNSSVVLNIKPKGKDAEKQLGDNSSEMKNQKNTTGEMKKIQRREANRISARSSRKRKKIMLSTLEEQLKRAQCHQKQLMDIHKERKKDIENRLALRARASLVPFNPSTIGTVLQQHSGIIQRRVASSIIGHQQDLSLPNLSSTVETQPVYMNQVANSQPYQVSINRGGFSHPMFFDPSLSASMMGHRQNPSLMPQAFAGILHPALVSRVTRQQLHQGCINRENIHHSSVPLRLQTTEAMQGSTASLATTSTEVASQRQIQMGINASVVQAFHGAFNS